MRLNASTTIRDTVASLAGALLLALAIAPAAQAGAPCTIRGTAGDDVLRGTPQADVICGLGGDDTIRAGGGHDTVLAGPGDDRVFGGRGGDRLLGGAGGDLLKGGPGRDAIGQGDLLRANGNWVLSLLPSYDLPGGSTVTYTYDRDSGNCLPSPWNWTITLNADGVDPKNPTGIRMGEVNVGEGPHQSCFWQRTYGSWDVVVKTPRGTTERLRIELRTGAPNAYVHQTSVSCGGNPRLGCSGGSDSVFNDDANHPKPPLRLGPIEELVEPRLICNAGLDAPVGQKLSTDKGHICTIEGVPRPTVTVEGLPPGLTFGRWPTTKDTWLVLQGTPSRFQGQLTVSASLPGGFSAKRYVQLDFR